MPNESHIMLSTLSACITGTLIFVATATCFAQRPSDQQLAELQTGLRQLQTKVGQLSKRPELQNRDGRARLADVAVFAKAVEWMLRHNEFPQKGYANQAAKAIEIGLQRAQELQAKAALCEATFRELTDLCSRMR